MSHDRPPSDREICVLNTIGQFIDINNIMPWLDVCFFGIIDFRKEPIIFTAVAIGNDFLVLAMVAPQSFQY